MKLNKKTFYDKVFGCWIGKNIGGTLGTPDEWKRQLNNYTFYTHNINGDPLPNDDLDLQIIWLKCLEDNGPNITARDLALYWQLYEIANYGEYGVARANLNAGIEPPISGILNNEKKHSCGAFIRSEIWACICPGRPDLAVQYALEDAIVDHGNGEGTYAEFFTAAMESAAFVEKDINKLIKVGLSYIPKNCGVAKAIETVFECYNKKMDWKDCRDEILEKHSGCVPDHLERLCSERDKAKGYHKGILGYDVPSNIAIIVAGLLYGEGDFEKSLLITANMGEDTDCTAGFVGALFGIINGYSNLPQKWVEPIGHKIKVMCCNEAHGNDYIPKTVEELTDRVIDMARMVCAYKGCNKKKPTMDIFTDDENDLSDVVYEKLLFENTELYKTKEVDLNLNGPRYDTPDFKIALDYEDYIMDKDGEVKITVKISQINWAMPQVVNVKFVSEDLYATPGEDVQMNIWIGKGIQKSEFILSPFEAKAEYRGHFEITTPGSIAHVTIPVYFTAYRRETDAEYNKSHNIVY